MDMWSVNSINDILETAGGQAAVFLEWSSQVILAGSITAIIVGLLVCFLGLKLLRVLSAVSGLSVGAGIGTAVVLGLRFSGTMIPVTILLCAVMLAVLCGGIERLGAFFAVFMHTAGVIAALFAPGIMSALFTADDLMSLFTVRLAVSLGISVAAALLAAVLAVVRTEPVTVVITGLSGGLAAGLAASSLLGISGNIWAGYGIGAVLALLGIWTQFMMQSRKIGRKEEVYSRQMKEQVSMESEVEKARKILEEDDEEEEDTGKRSGGRGTGSKDKGNRGVCEDTEEDDDDDITIISEDL